MAGDRMGTVLEPGTPDGDASLLRSSLVSALAGTGPVVVDLTSVRVVDGATVALLVAASRELGPRRSLAVVVSPALAEAFREWRLDTLWTTGTDRDAVCASVRVNGR